MSKEIQAILAHYEHDPTRLIDIIWDVQRKCGYVPGESVNVLSEALNLSPVQVSETVSFYHFFRSRPFGKHAIYLCDSVIGRMRGHAEVRDALECATGARDRKSVV